MEKPWTDHETMRRMYVESDLNGKEIAERLDCSEYTTSVWIRRHGLKEYQPKNGIYQHEDKGGYRRIQVRHSDDEWTTIGESALAALAAGADPYDVFDPDTEIHHKNRHTLDNTPSNVEAVTNEKHKQIHEDEIWVVNDGRPEILSESQEKSKMRLEAGGVTSDICAD